MRWLLPISSITAVLAMPSLAILWLRRMSSEIGISMRNWGKSLSKRCARSMRRIASDLTLTTWSMRSTAAPSVAKLLYRLGRINKYGYGGLNVKFRPKNGILDQKYTIWEVSVPLMRVEEMKLIEIEAAGMQDLTRGKQLLTEFAKTRDPQYVYGKHNEAYYNTKTSEFQNEVWWQRRVELWGEGFATFDIKRLNKGIIRSYAGTNHIEGARWNTNSVPNWMVWTFIGTESGTNGGMTLNPDPVQPSEDSPAFKW